MVQYLTSVGIPQERVILITPPPLNEAAWEKECILKGERARLVCRSCSMRVLRASTPGSCHDQVQTQRIDSRCLTLDCSRHEVGQGFWCVSQEGIGALAPTVCIVSCQTLRVTRGPLSAAAAGSGMRKAPVAKLWTGEVVLWTCLSCLNPEDGFDRNTIIAFQHPSAAKTREESFISSLAARQPSSYCTLHPSLSLRLCLPPALFQDEQACPMPWELGSMYLAKCVHFVLESA